MAIMNIIKYPIIFNEKLLEKDFSINPLIAGFKGELNKRDKNITNNLNPTEDYCVVSVGRLHVPSIVNKLQSIGYKTDIFVPPKTKTLHEDINAYESKKRELLKGFEETRNSKKEAIIIADTHTRIYSLEGILKEPKELIERGIKKINICLEHSKRGNEEKFLFKNGKHCFHIYDELRKYAEKCKKIGIDLELIGLECREDGIEIC